MSKASEWAKLDAQMRLEIAKGDIARVDARGITLTHYDLSGNISEQISYDLEDAIKLARWILDVFGEPQ